MVLLPGPRIYKPSQRILAPKLRILKIQITYHMKLKKKEDQSVDVSVLLRRGNKILKDRRKYGDKVWSRD